MSSLMVAQHNAAGTTGNHHSLPHLDILQRLGSLVTTLDMVDRDPCSRVGLFWYYILNTKQTNLDWRKPAPKNYIHTIWLEILVGVLPKCCILLHHPTPRFYSEQRQTPKLKTRQSAICHPSRSPECWHYGKFWSVLFSFEDENLGCVSGLNRGHWINWGKRTLTFEYCWNAMLYRKRHDFI